MKSIAKGNIYLLLVALSGIFSYLIIIANAFPYLGIAISLATLSTIVYFLKKEKTTYHQTLYALTLLLSFCIMYRANGFLTFLNITAVIFLGSLMSLPQIEFTQLGFLHFAFSPLNLFFRALVTKSEYYFNPNTLKNNSLQIKKDTAGEIIKSVLISLVILILIVPLLASANPLFNKLVTDFVRFFNLKKVIEYLLLSQDYVLWLARLLVFFILIVFIPRLLTLTNLTTHLHHKLQSTVTKIHLLLPKTVVALILLLFFITQAQLYFASPQTLQLLGYTNSRYANEVFAQLTIVTIIIIALMYNDKNRSHWAKILTYILILEGFFLASIALKSVYDYSAQWGLTYKRLWGYAGVIWITAVLSFFAYKYYKNHSDTRFVKFVILFSALLLIGINCINFDYLIYHYGKSTTQQGTDYFYLASLSPDSRSYKEQIEILAEKALQDSNENETNTYTETQALQRLLYKISDLQYKYKNLDLRAFNLSEYIQYQEIKDINTEKYYNLITEHYKNKGRTNYSRE
jgi:hypothetical protein